ncbi:hypothetical protein RclHR1_01330017 [Rhizophagus clarus]|uniref:Uncharacterized protein n=1 Tax=Rhizophagus clarus TaxID=94130 RepID=A0A2Z6Q9Q0_9GLOM|nr:hypothetical protein RclHR1_01330017 [Rhizophagus clarus]
MCQNNLCDNRFLIYYIHLKNFFQFATLFKEIAMSNIYQAIANLDSNEERTALRIFFIQNPKQRTEAELILPTCSSNEEVVAFLKELLKYGMFSLISVIFANNTEYLPILALFLPASYSQTRPKNTFALL